MSTFDPQEPRKDMQAEDTSTPVSNTPVQPPAETVAGTPAAPAEHTWATPGASTAGTDDAHNAETAATSGHVETAASAQGADSGETAANNEAAETTTLNLPAPQSTQPLGARLEGAQTQNIAASSTSKHTEPLPPLGAAGSTQAPASPYTSVPQTPAGYSFTRSTGASAGTSTSPLPAYGSPYTYANPYTSPSGTQDAGASAAPGGQPTPFSYGESTGHSSTGTYEGGSTTAADPFATTTTLPRPQGEQGENGTSMPGPIYGVGVPGSYEYPQGKRRKKTKRTPGWGGVIAATLAAALLASGGTAVGMHYLDRDHATNTTTTFQRSATSGTTKTVSTTGEAPDWEAVAKAVSDAVVSITVATSSGTAMGSGVIYDSSGHIITNHHVVSGASQIQVTLADGRIYAAKLTGTDPATDLAVIQLENAPSDLTVARFGNSDDVVTGEDVMAIGNPLGLSSTVTTGIVSAIDRPVVTTQESDSGSDSSSSSQLPGGLGELLRPQTTQTSQTYTNAIQIDAAINPGNSGGPLFDETGQVIGITSSIAQVSEESGSIGLGFAIPGNLATKVADQLIKSGKATHAYLGVTITDGAAKAGDVTRAGAQVGTVESGSPADKAGLKQGDVITAINGKSTSQAAALTAFVRQYSAGDAVTLTIVRDGEEKQVQVTLAEREDS